MEACRPLLGVGGLVFSLSGMFLTAPESVLIAYIECGEYPQGESGNGRTVENRTFPWGRRSRGADEVKEAAMETGMGISFQHCLLKMWCQRATVSY
jgi:hypothetical protein